MNNLTKYYGNLILNLYGINNQYSLKINNHFENIIFSYSTTLINCIGWYRWVLNPFGHAHHGHMLDGSYLKYKCKDLFSYTHITDIIRNFWILWNHITLKNETQYLSCEWKLNLKEEVWG